ncbi:embryonic protein UVS.2-like [Gastrophryne carolinensis]
MEDERTRGGCRELKQEMKRVQRTEEKASGSTEYWREESGKAEKHPKEAVVDRGITGDSKEAEQPIQSLRRPPPEDVMSTIERMNRGSRKALRFGDIDMAEGRSALSCPSGKCFWPKSADGLVNVPYTLEWRYSEDDRATIAQAMLEFATLTCVRFVPRTTESNYLNIISDSGCWSSLGRAGGAQDLSLERDGCMLNGVVQHELNHALGFHHEQCRSDRDAYVKILWENILPGYNASFSKFETNNLNLEYDYYSVMHYGKYTFTKDNSKQTIQPIPQNDVIIGQRIGLSNLDVAKINRLYDCNVCSTVLSTNTGVFSSASYPSNYPNNYNCSWLIRLPITQNQIFLQFKAFDVQSSAGCTSDYIRVFDGPSRTSPLLLDRACGLGQMPSLVSSGSLMLVEFVSDGSLTATGFKASYSPVNCGGTYTSFSGTVSSPRYDGNTSYPPYSDCTWTILAPSGYKIQLSFSSFSLEPSSPCSYDFLEIRDGILPTAQHIGASHCGTETLKPITSTKNGLLLHFVSDSYNESTGFLAKYTFVPAA